MRTIAAARAEALGATLHLPLDDTSGTTAVATTGSNATYEGTPGYRVAGPTAYLPHGISSSGSQSVYRSIDPNGGGAQTWEMWLNSPATLNSSTTRYAMGSTGSGNGGAIVFGPATSDLSSEVCTIFRQASSSTERTGWSGSTLSAGWHHHAWTYNGSQNGWLWYIDGVAATSSGFSKISSGGGSYGLLNQTWYLLRWPAGGYSTWSGAAAWSVYNKELTPAEVSTNYRLGLDLARGTSHSPVSY